MDNMSDLLFKGDLQPETVSVMWAAEKWITMHHDGPKNGALAPMEILISHGTFDVNMDVLKEFRKDGQKRDFAAITGLLVSETNHDDAIQHACRPLTVENIVSIKNVIRDTGKTVSFDPFSKNVFKDEEGNGITEAALIYLSCIIDKWPVDEVAPPPDKVHPEIYILQDPRQIPMHLKLKLQQVNRHQKHK